MPIANYGVLKCRALDQKAEETDDTPHFQVHAVAVDKHYRLAVNVRSQTQPPDLLFFVEENYEHPITAQLEEVEEGFTPLQSKPGGVALDFIRANLFDRTEMHPLPNNDLSAQLEHYMTRAISEAESTQVFAFGQLWGPEQKPDKVFQFQPGDGIHDIHMNQGNAGEFAKDNGVWQDGGLLIHFNNPQSQWVAFFMAFQSQAWHTDDQTGQALEALTPGPATTPSANEPDFRVRIVGALINPAASAQGKSLTLLNASPDIIDLEGWTLADSNKRKASIAGVLEPGATLAVAVPDGISLDPAGGIISLLDDRGLKVDGVNYTSKDTSRPGWTTVF